MLAALPIVSAGYSNSVCAEGGKYIAVPKQPEGMVDPSQNGVEFKVEVKEEEEPWLPENVVVLPIPSQEPVFGWGLGLLVGTFLDLDEEHPDTPPSQVGLLGSYRENGTWYAGVGGVLNMFDDTLRASGGLFYGTINSRFWGVGTDNGSQDEYADVEQKVSAVLVQALYRIFDDGYLGLGYVSGKADTKLKLNRIGLPPGFDTVEETIRIGGIEVPFQYDSRDNQMYPRQGWLVDADAIFFREAVGSDFNSENYSFAANKYITVRKRDVLAFRGWTSFADEDTPFYLLPSIGGREDMRGYEDGRYVDRAAYTMQAEYRWQINDSWIATGFAGVGGVGSSYSKLLKDPLPAAGVGGRYVLNKAYNVTLGADVAVGKNGAVFYFSVGEAF